MIAGSLYTIDCDVLMYQHVEKPFDPNALNNEVFYLRTLREDLKYVFISTCVVLHVDKKHIRVLVLTDTGNTGWVMRQYESDTGVTSLTNGTQNLTSFAFCVSMLGFSWLVLVVKPTLVAHFVSFDCARSEHVPVDLNDPNV